MNYTNQKITICILLMVTTFGVYFQIKDHAFTNWDDSIYCCLEIYAAGLTSDNVKWAFTTFATAMWMPITFLSHLLDFEIFGPDPSGHHLTNVFFHIANALLLFWVLLKMTGKLWQSGFVAAMFAFHPINVESVAWAAERKNVLSTLFWLLTMWAYTHYTEKKTIKRYGLFFLFLTLGMLTKPMLVTLPFVLLLLDYWPLRRFSFGNESGNNNISEKNSVKKSEALRLVFEKIPLVLLTIGLSIVTYIAELRFRLEGNYTEQLTFPTRLINTVASYLEYLRKVIWPENLAFFYPYPGDTAWKGIFCGMALVGITIISIKLIRKAPYFAVGWFWYLGTLLPVIGIVPIGEGWPGAIMSDRYAYIPFIGIFIIIAWGLPELISKWRYKEKVLSISAGIVILTLLITTWEQVSHWKNSITIFKHTIRVTDKEYPNLAIVHNNLGIAFFDEKKNEEAISSFRTAIRLMPNNTKAHYNLGIALFTERKTEEAISHYQMAIKLKPYFTDAHYNLGIILLQKGEVKEAVHHFRETLRLRPGFVQARDYLELAMLHSEGIE
jgi:tetratricopeptide (TPR) repeat protein